MPIRVCSCQLTKDIEIQKISSCQLNSGQALECIIIVAAPVSVTLRNGNFSY